MAKNFLSPVYESFEKCNNKSSVLWPKCTKEVVVYRLTQFTTISDILQINQN